MRTLLMPSSIARYTRLAQCSTVDPASFLRNSKDGKCLLILKVGDRTCLLLQVSLMCEFGFACLLGRDLYAFILQLGGHLLVEGFLRLRQGGLAPGDSRTVLPLLS